MNRVALVSSNRWQGRAIGDLQIQEHLQSKGIIAEIVSWEQDVQWEDYDLCILRSAWDYYNKMDAFVKWLHSLKKYGCRFMNPPDRIIQNINKDRQLLFLDSCPVQPLPYEVLSENDTVQAIRPFLEEHRRIVVKPTIAAGGYHAFRYNSDAFEYAFNQMIEQCGFFENGCRAIIQPYVESIECGEYSLVYFYGQFSHAFLRFPGVFAEKRPAQLINRPNGDLLSAGDKICQFVHAEELLYLRIDLVEFKGNYYIMEIEEAEPDLYLSLDHSHKPMASFAEAIENTLND